MKIERITIRQVVGNEINLAVRDLMISGLFPDAAKFQGEKEFIPALLAEYGLKLDKIRHDLKGGEISIRDAAETITDMLEEANKNLKRFPTGLKWLNDFVSKKQDEINFASYVLEKIAFECAADEIEETPGYDRLLKIYNSTRADIIANNMGLDEKTTAPQGEKALEIYQKMLETLEDIRNQIAAIKDGAGVSMEKEETETQPKRAENIIREPSYYIKRDLREGDKAYKLMLFLAENVNTYLSMKQLHEFIQSAGSKAHPSSLIFDTKIPKYYSTWPYEIRKEGNLRTAKYGLFAKENAQTEDGAEIARSAAKDVKDAGELQSPHKTQQKQEEKEELTMNELKYFIETNTNRGGNAKRILLKGAEYPLEEGFNLKKAAEECNIEYSQNLYVTILSIVRRFSDKKIQLVHTGKGNFIFRKNVEISEADNGDNGNLQPGADPDGSGNDGDNGDLPPTAKYGLFAKDGAGDVNKFAANAVKPQPETEKKEQADEAGNEAKKPSEPQKPLSQKKPVTETAPIPEEAKKKAVELIENICKHKTTPRYFIWLYLAERLGEKIQKTELIKYLGQKLPAKKWLDQTITNEIRLFNAKQYQYEITADRSRTGSIWSAAYSMILVKTQTAEKETADYQKEIPLNATAEFEEFIKELQRYKRSKKAVETAKAFGSLHINRKLQFLEIMRRCQKQNADVNSANVNYFLTKLINDRSFGKIIVEKAGYGEYIIRVNKEGKKLETAKKGQRDLEYMVEITDSKGKTLTE
ncbi:hypothetical protein KKG51_02510, partial [Patescibacteria group bacterium]|nr:hypothetical protein [Patescibacteria group bacterium]